MLPDWRAEARRLGEQNAATKAELDALKQDQEAFRLRVISDVKQELSTTFEAIKRVVDDRVIDSVRQAVTDPTELRKMAKEGERARIERELEERHRKEAEDAAELALKTQERKTQLRNNTLAAVGGILAILATIIVALITNHAAH